MIPDLFNVTTSKQVTRHVIFEGADPNAVNEHGEPPLHVALKRSIPLPAIVELVRLGAQVNAINRSRLSPLYLAVQHRDIRVMEHLIDKGALARSPGALLTPLHAAVFNNYFDKVELLLSLGADPNQPGPRLATPLFAARSEAMAARLMKAGANPYLRDRKGRNAIEWMLEQGYTEAAGALMGKPVRHRILQMVGGDHV